MIWQEKYVLNKYFYIPVKQPLQLGVMFHVSNRSYLSAKYNAKRCGNLHLFQSQQLIEDQREENDQLSHQTCKVPILIESNKKLNIPPFYQGKQHIQIFEYASIQIIQSRQSQKLIFSILKWFIRRNGGREELSGKESFILILFTMT